jgi:hypothetical protein
VPTRHAKIGIWENNIPLSREQLRQIIDNLIATADTQDYKSIVSAIKRIIPEYIGDKVRNN